MRRGRRYLQMSKPPEERPWAAAEVAGLHRQADGTYSLDFSQVLPGAPEQSDSSERRAAAEEEREQEWRRIQAEGTQRRLQAHRRERRASGRR